MATGDPCPVCKRFPCGCFSSWQWPTFQSFQPPPWSGEPITLRDWLAGQFISGWFADSMAGTDTAALALAAQRAYEMADAMLKARMA